MEGYIALHRKITENEFYFSEKFTKSQAWIDLLILATHKARIIYIRNIEINLNPGELCYSQKSLADRWKWNFKTVKKFLNLLKKRGMVDTKTNNLTTIITIKNWQFYQVLGSQPDKKGERPGEQKGEQKESKKDINNNVDNVNNDIITEKVRSKSSKKIEVIKNNSILYSVVNLYSKIQNRSIESSDYAFINRLLKLKQEDSYTYAQRCLMLCSVMKAKSDKINEVKYKGILYNSYKDLSYTNYHKSVFETRSNRIEIKTDKRIINEPSINY